MPCHMLQSESELAKTATMFEKCLDTADTSRQIIYYYYYYYYYVV